MCVEECRKDCLCFMTIYRKKKCQLFKKEAQYYLNSTGPLNQTSNDERRKKVHFKEAMLEGTMYIANGKMSFMKCHTWFNLID